jgi:hypothetical protein
MRAYVSFFLVGLAAAACGRVEGVPIDAPACTLPSDCTDPAAPYCVGSMCVASCSTNSDCSDPMHAVCAGDGACVQCTMNAECSTATAPICDGQARACRGCSKDSECAGGVCVEAEGACVADADTVFVTMMGTDSGTCTRAAPCASITYATSQAGARRVIHVLGGSLSSNGVNLSGNRVLDGEDTTLSGGSPPLTISGGTVVVEGFRVAGPPAGTTAVPAISVTTAGTKATLYNMTVTGTAYGAVIAGAGGTFVTLRKSKVGSLTMTNSMQVSCQNGTLVADQNTFENTFIAPVSGTCETTVTRNRFESNRDGSVQQNGGHLTMENNLIIHRDGYNDSLSITNLGAGSVVRFNTIVNTTAVASDGSAMYCDTSVIATSNIFAYNSGHPITGQGCAPKYSVFDEVSTTSAGPGNQITNIDSIFVDRASGDYHLAAGSVARAGAEPGLTMVKTDIEGNPRPSPMGSTADCGAFEAP